MPDVGAATKMVCANNKLFYVTNRHIYMLTPVRKPSQLQSSVSDLHFVPTVNIRTRAFSIVASSLEYAPS